MSSTVVFDLGIDHSKRDLAGYGDNPPNPQWPNNAKVCLSFVLNYEEGGEHTTGPDEKAGTSNFNQDEHAETFLTESGVAASVPGAARYGRNLGTESGFEYGSHRGFHRILDLFRRSQLRFTSWAIGRAVELNPQVATLMQEAGCEVGSHSWRWIDYWEMPEEEERKHVKLAIEAIKKASGKIPRGWYTGRQSVHTRRIVYETYREMGALDQLYDNDSCGYKR
jgi:peptidoglycan/xylan/chitin deacetylase (PgdA/CDA1 family)